MKICHHGDQYLLVLVPTSSLNGRRLHFHTYPLVVELVEGALLEAEIGSSRETTPEEPLLFGDREILSFFNVAFTPNSPAKDDKRTFSFESLSLEEIYKITKNYTGRFRSEKVSESDNILNLLPHYLAEVAKLEEENYTIIGYARKSVLHSIFSTTDRSPKKRFVSPSSQSTEPIASRDMEDSINLMTRLKNIDGDTQGS
ncbi:hypothetical protein G6F46_001565 [Rhizopus delemar]|uniref:Uncharacterized protein n=2 Tax=Rhizopus TaxID=4842 RepID=A0A9P6ZBQ6_9FUNG|nr:hypothetical protein G6F36_013405 [Rhizopus arrhizus]KAG1464844.1 hypothetical protein G6F55_001521 [Rhizopus delemar]KAG1500560.1 hypothetical protein G6F54_003632 [Rhizopus delemar]KAG1514247.1 hypothetical protein G6F53_003819 [Rhizopus delemar]KAG1550095.1 hypothetical protein G6F51_002653 [Rhizopus arrhizus]